MARRYPPISDYALLADSFSAALVSPDCSVDWACLRRFDNASCFGRLLDWDRGGYFSLAPRQATEVTRRYLEGSLVLETTITVQDGGRIRILDALAMRAEGKQDPPHLLLRVIEGVDGEVDVDVHLEPRFDYGSLRPWVRHHDEGATAPSGEVTRW